MASCPFMFACHGTLLICRMGCPLTEIVIETAIAPSLNSRMCKSNANPGPDATMSVVCHHPFPPSPPREIRPSFGQRAPFSADGCKCCALLLFVPVASDAPASSVARPPPEGRDWRGRKVMEETMRVLTLTELMRLTRIELCALLTRITNELTDFPEGSAERDNALTTLRNIRWVLARRRDYSP